ncbi:hypothetical protein ASPSYDRAFT_144837 [Aspergillus sydowii CBS 593.65]|uniref:Rhodopsin domain-containing protein n=1 Tax=Aspergillus sydowii CBS 593.65 TaxID=1036612 RepID=A0A1L9TUJ9_9EURO|nr:uncharacterized protein ASPSYDRAFT_144837 [Aspergillus sydowii CBS 593.65]OJJ63055.1 hypothetical protein ASPSYDRAFT_144837 [Aspergillus sydowii CBS 593.65]
MGDQSASLYGVAVTFVALSSISVALRCYVRLRVVKAFGWDDFVMILAMVFLLPLFYIMLCGCMIGASVWGTGKHLSEVTRKQRSNSLVYWFLGDISYAISSILAKISVCIFLLRVVVSPLHRRVLYGATTLAVTSGIVFFILMLAQCSPVSFWWKRVEGDTDGKCGVVNTVGIMLYVFSVTSAAFDMTVGLLPIILVRGLQMNRKTKIAAASLLGLACIASVAIIIRIPYIMTIHDHDFLSPNNLKIAIWSSIEIGLSITAGSLATLRPLFRTFSSRSSTRYNPFANGPSSPSNFKKPRKSRFNARNLTEEPLTFATVDSGLGLGRKKSPSALTTLSHRSNSTDKERSERPRGSVFEPFTGVPMTSMRSTVDIEGREAGGVQAPERSANPGSRIEIHRTFEVSRSSE